jgi:hypothetical protein
MRGGCRNEQTHPEGAEERESAQRTDDDCECSARRDRERPCAADSTRWGMASCVWACGWRLRSGGLRQRQFRSVCLRLGAGCASGVCMLLVVSPFSFVCLCVRLDGFSKRGAVRSRSWHSQTRLCRSRDGEPREKPTTETASTRNNRTIRKHEQQSEILKRINNHASGQDSALKRVDLRLRRGFEILLSCTCPVVPLSCPSLLRRVFTACSKWPAAS